jgi:hypothetical protein
VKEEEREAVKGITLLRLINKLLFEGISKVEASEGNYN